MFSTIFQYELKYWLRQPSIYIYAIIFFLLSMLMMADDAGVWLDQPKDFIANSPIELFSKITWFTKLILFLLPTILGVAIYRDIKSGMFNLLYVYPMTKRTYLLAKLSSAFLVLVFIVSFIGLGLFAGTLLPNAKPEMLASFDSLAYLQTYFFILIPNMLFLGALIFGIVALTRNIYIGFVSIIVLMIVQAAFGSLAGQAENEYLVALLEPLGNGGIQYYIRYWTPVEQVENYLPIQGVLVFNRLLWLSIGVLIFVFTYWKFRFSQQSFSLAFSRKKGETVVKNNFGSISKINLTPIQYDFSFLQQLKTTWQLSNAEFRYIIRHRMFLTILIVGSLAIFIQVANIQPTDGFEILPTTWKMLSLPMIMFSGIINILTFLYAGMLVQRARVAEMSQLIDTSATSNWSLMLSKFFALLKMQLALLSLVLIAGVTAQLYNGFWDIDFTQYFFGLYILNFIGFALWAMVAIFIQTIFTNAYLGFFLLLLGSIGMAALPQLGVEPAVFRYNMGPSLEYSDMNGYGNSLMPYLAYKIYWLIFGLFLIIGTHQFWVRGLTFSFLERFKNAWAKSQSRVGVAMILLLVVFGSLGFKIYQEDYLKYAHFSNKEKLKKTMQTYHQKYGRYANTPQPKIVAVKTELDIYPDEKRFEATGQYILVNKTNEPIDTLIIRTGFDEQTTYQLEKSAEAISQDADFHFDVWKLKKVLAPNDSIKLSFDIKSRENAFFDTYPNVSTNGTFIAHDAFPRLGYQKTEMKPNPMHSDSSQHHISYMTADADWIDFEAIVSTSEDQIALAPGYIQKEWTENNRRYFHYKMDSPIKFFFGFNSAKYEVLRDNLDGVSLEVYHIDKHPYNIHRMMKGLKGTLKYCNENFSQYQHQQARIIEYPMTMGSHSTTFANSIPFAEQLFIADIQESEGDIDLPFYVAAHELAHQWWGNQVIPADMLGAKMLTESLAEYTALKVLEKEYGKDQMRQFLKLDLDSYLKGRNWEYNTENTLSLVKAGQEYIAYRKGALVFYALSDYIGEEKLNQILSDFIKKVSYRLPYTTSFELIELIKKEMPTEYAYLIDDMFLNITLYNNKVNETKVRALENGKFEVTIDFNVQKYNIEGKGKKIFKNKDGASISYASEALTKDIQSLPLQDFIEIGVFGENGQVLYLKKHKITEIHNLQKIIVDEQPIEIGVDPYHKLIDRDSDDNLKKL